MKFTRFRAMASAPGAGGLTLVAALPFAASGLISAAPQMQVRLETLPGVPQRVWSLTPARLPAPQP